MCDDSIFCLYVKACVFLCACMFFLFLSVCGFVCTSLHIFLDVCMSLYSHLCVCESSLECALESVCVCLCLCAQRRNWKCDLRAWRGACCAQTANVYVWTGIGILQGEI